MGTTNNQTFKNVLSLIIKSVSRK
uniref:Uncharacterized protein n=1 Tax=Lepeophtheirus salmonis TaxID=72036 RepID=A0A0K2V0C3_LEPSM